MGRWIGKATGLRRIAPVVFTGFMLCLGTGLPGAESPSRTPSREELGKLLEDTNPRLRAYAVYSIAYRFSEDSKDLVPFIRDEDASVRRAAIFSLGLLHFESEAQRFLEALKDPDYGVRRAAVFALGNIESRQAIEGVAGVLKDSDSIVRQLAILAMARAGLKSSVPKLIPRLRDESPRVRRAAACALGMLGDRSALDPLKRLHRDRKRSQPPKSVLLADEKVQKTLKKKVNLGYKFLHFVDILDKLSKAAGVDIRVDDEVLFMLNTSASDPSNLNSIRLDMWNVPFEKALGKVVETVGAYYYVESGTINISSGRYRAYDTPVLLEVTGAMALLGDRSALSELRNFLKDPRCRSRARQLLRAVTGR
ncbi:HEAT repeat domain-containing protein [bacterium]|nr:HEAT repeat domain-containing protein [bacterium]